MSMIKKLFLTSICVVAVLLLSQQVFAARGTPKENEEIKVRRVEMAMTTATVRVNQVRTLYVEIIPRDAENQNITWTSSNPEVAAVDGEGMVTGISPGTTTVTATSDNGKSDQCVVTVPGSVLTGIELQTGNNEHTLADVSNGEILNAATLRLDVENAVKNAPSTQKPTVVYTGKTQVSTAALRSAAFSAKYEGGATTVIFRTLNNDGNIQGQLTISPENAPAEDKDLKVTVHTSSDKTASAQAHAAAALGRTAAVVRLAQEGSYGMDVQVAAKLDLSGQDVGSLKLYYYDGEAYAMLQNQSYRIDDSGYLHFTTNVGGIIAVAS